MNHDKKTELFWALMEFKERLWLAWAVWGKAENVAHSIMLRLIEQALDLVQYPQSPDLRELGSLLDELAAAAPDRRLDDDIANLKHLSFRYDQAGDAPD